MRPLRVLTWHIHGSYLYYLAHVPHTFFVPSKPGRPEGYGGRAGSLPWPDNLVEVPAEQVSELEFDCVLFQSRRNYEHDRYEILSPAQQRLPRIYLEHDPPRTSPTDTRHPVDDAEILLVHVTAFNDLMWDSGRTPTRVIDHGVLPLPDAVYTGERARGVVVVNDLARRGRRLGLDVYQRVRSAIPLDLVGMGARELGGVGELPRDRLGAFVGQHRFFFNPIRYTSLGLAVCEAMMMGMPIVGLATTEMATVVEDGVSGYIDTDVGRLIARMRELIEAPALARELGQGARARALARFHIDRFIADWDRTLRDVCGGRAPVQRVRAGGAA